MSGPQTAREPVSVVVLENGGRFYAYEPGLGLIASDDNPAGAYEKFVAMRGTLVAEAERAGLDLAAPSDAAPPAPQPGVWRELGIFVAKTGIVMALIAVILGPVAVAIGNGIGQAAGNAAQSLSRMGALSFEDVARKASDIARDVQDLPEEKREQLRRSIGVISREIAPMVDAWQNPPDGAAPSPVRQSR